MRKTEIGESKQMMKREKKKVSLKRERDMIQN